MKNSKTATAQEFHDWADHEFSQDNTKMTVQDYESIDEWMHVFFKQL